MLMQNGLIGEQPRQGIAAEWLRRLHPLRQLEYGVGAIVYLAAWIASGADVYLWLARRSSAMGVLGLSLVLWCCVLSGTWLTVVLEVDDPREELRQEIDHVRADRPLSG